MTDDSVGAPVRLSRRRAELDRTLCPMADEWPLSCIESLQELLSTCSMACRWGPVSPEVVHLDGEGYWAPRWASGESCRDR